MAKTFNKLQTEISLPDFLDKSFSVKSFASSSGKRYKVLRVENDEMFFIRLDAKSKEEWKMNLKQVYNAFKELDDFSIANFKRFVSLTHSPARGLLIHLRMLY